MTELVYPRRMTRRRRRIVVGAMVALYLVVFGLAWFLDAWGGAVGGLVSGGLVAFLSSRGRTVVTADTITVRGSFRTRTLPVARATELVDPGRFGWHVLVAPEDGYPFQLPKVTPADLPDIRALTGLPVRVSGRPE